jgi:hypothetical protein
LKDISTLRTRDMDFLVPLTAKFKDKVNVVELVGDLGFEEIYRGSQGYIKLGHAYLELEFLVPQKGGENDRPHKLLDLGINAQPLPFLDILIGETIQVEVGDVEIVLPHPVLFALHKLVVCKRRTGPRGRAKAEKDKKVAIQILNDLIEAKGIAPIKRFFASLHKNRQKTIVKVLQGEAEDSILEVLMGS